MFVYKFLIGDNELDLNILLAGFFLSLSFKVGFCTRSKHNFGGKGKVFRIYSNKPPMRYKKYGYNVYIKEQFQYNVYIPDTPCVDYDNNWWTNIIDRMQKQHQIFLLDSCIFPSNLSFFLLLIVHLIRMQQPASFSCYRTIANCIINYYIFDGERLPKLY